MFVQLCGIPTIYAHLTPPFLAISGSEYPLVPPYQDEGEYGEELNWGNAVPVILSAAKDPIQEILLRHGGQVANWRIRMTK